MNSKKFRNKSQKIKPKTKTRDNEIVFKWRQLTGRIIKKKEMFWKDLESFVRDREKTVNDMEMNICGLEATLSAAQDEIESFENALLEVTALYEDSLAKNKETEQQNQCLREMIEQLTIEGQPRNSPTHSRHTGNTQISLTVEDINPDGCSTDSSFKLQLET